jgi:hypothetical protein
MSMTFSKNVLQSFSLGYSMTKLTLQWPSMKDVSKSCITVYIIIDPFRNKGTSRTELKSLKTQKIAGVWGKS